MCKEKTRGGGFKDERPGKNALGRYVMGSHKRMNECPPKPSHWVLRMYTACKS